MSALGKYKDAHYLGEFFVEVIEELIVDTCAQIVTDNGHVASLLALLWKPNIHKYFGHLTF